MSDQDYLYITGRPEVGGRLKMRRGTLDTSSAVITVSEDLGKFIETRYCVVDADELVRLAHVIIANYGHEVVAA